MKLKNLDRFYREVQTIDIRFENVEGRTPAMTLEHYDQSTANYDAQITELRELALTTVLTFTHEQIQYNANRLQLINERFSRFWKWYSGQLKKQREGEFSTYEFMYQLNGFLNNNHSNTDMMLSWTQDTQSFLHDLHDAAMYKQGGVKYLLYLIRNVAGIEPKLKENTEERAEEEKTLKNRVMSYKWIDGEADTAIPRLYTLFSNYLVDTTLGTFIAIFSELPTSNITPVKWNGLSSELLYFIRALSQRGLVNANAKSMSYIQLKGCFVKADGKPLDSDFKSLNQRLDIDLGNNRKEQIDILLAEFQ